MAPLVVGTAFVFVVFVSLIVFRRIANSNGLGLVTCEPQIKGGKTLIVLAHGTRGTGAYLTCMYSILANVRSDADLLPLQYPEGFLSNADPYLVSEQICQKIHDAYKQVEYDCIILVGYSKGALLIWKALVYGCGHIEDLDTEPGASRPVLPWVRKVKRLVLLAGMNCGWTMRKRPQQMPLHRFWLLKFIDVFSRWIGVGRFIHCCESGEPFVANLRLQWLELMRSLPTEERLTVIQLLGDKDDVVSSEDQRDVTVAKDFIWVRVHNTGHADIVDLDDPLSGPERRGKIAKALGSADDIESLRQLSTRLPDNEDPLVREAVIVLHGIRDMGAWTSQFEISASGGLPPQTRR